MRKGRKFLLFSICGLLVSAFSCALFQPKTSKVNAASDTYILIGDHQGGWNNTDDRYAMTHDSANNQYYFKDIYWTEGQQWRITWAGEWGDYAGWDTLQNKETFEDDFEPGSADNNIKCKRDCYYDIYIKSNNEIYPAYAAYTVTLNKNGGVVSFGDDITGYQYGDEKTLPTLQKEGCDFLGWFDNPSFTGNQIYEITEVDHGNKTYYAKFDTAKVALSYNLNGGTLTGGLPADLYNYNTSVPEPTATRNDYRLTGWENGDGETVTFPFNLTKSTELVAKWEPSTFYTITLDVNNSNYGSVSPDTLQVPIDSVVSIQDNIICFNEIQAVATPKPPQGLAQYNFVSWIGIEAGDVIKSNKTITANFEETDRKYNLAWDFMGGTATGGTPAGEYNYNTEIFAPEDISKTGKYFDGWYDNSSYEGDPYDFPYNITKNITFYAKWVDTHTLTIINSDERSAQSIFSDLKHDAYMQFPTIESIFGNDFHEPFGRRYVGLKSNPASETEEPIKNFRITSDMTLYACYAFYDVSYYEYSFDDTNYTPFTNIRNAGGDEPNCLKVYYKGGLTVNRGSQLYIKANNEIINFSPTTNTNLDSNGKVKVSASNVYIDLKLSTSGTYLVHIGGTPESDTPFISIGGFLSKLTKSTTADEYYIQSININANDLVEAYWNQYYNCSLDPAVDSTYFELNSDNKIVCKKNGSYDAYLKKTSDYNYNMFYIAPHGLADATEYAKHFISEISKICSSTKDGGDIASLRTEWGNEKNLFLALKDDATRLWLTYASPIEDDEDYLNRFAALYDYIYTKYGSNVGDNFANRNIQPMNSSQNRFLLLNENSSSYVVVTVVSFIGLVTISTFIFRKKHSN